MHPSALASARRFFETYVTAPAGLRVIEVGSQDVNGSLREVTPAGVDYVGLDFVPGRGVDVLIKDPYHLPLPDDSADIVVCSSCFEHSEFFWLLFNDIMRLLKPQGLLYLNVPSNGDFHRYPVDCWRFYPDSGLALQNWARRSGYATTLLESYIGRQDRGVYNDFVGVFVKDGQYAGLYPGRIHARFDDYRNGWQLGAQAFSRPALTSEDQELHLLRSVGRAGWRMVGRLYDRLPAMLQRPLKALYHAGDGRP